MLELFKVNLEKVVIILFVLKVKLEDFEEFLERLDMLDSNRIFLFFGIIFVLKNSFDLLDLLNWDYVIFQKNNFHGMYERLRWTEIKFA